MKPTRLRITLPRPLDVALATASAARKLTREQIAREALRAYLQPQNLQPTPQ